jgi:hypothetical protein
VHWTPSGLLAIFDGDRGAFFTVIVVALLVGGVVVLVLNLSARPRAPPAPKWEPVPDDAPAAAAPARTVQPARPPTTQPSSKPPARRRA